MAGPHLPSLALLLLLGACAREGEPARTPPGASAEPTLQGRLRLPEGDGSRGVEILATVAENGEERTVWVRFDEDGGFSHPLPGTVTDLRVTAGIGAVVHRIEAGELPSADREGRIDVGVVDLRDRLKRHRMRVRAGEGAPGGAIRIAMWSGPPPTGPLGEPVSLGSLQFPERVLGDEVEWLVPPDARDLYFLVERPSGPGRDRDWRSGRQRLFGPFPAAGIPAELVVD